MAVYFLLHGSERWILRHNAESTWNHVPSSRLSHVRNGKVRDILGKKPNPAQVMKKSTKNSKVSFSKNKVEISTKRKNKP
jgi:hypothetical protein